MTAHEGVLNLPVKDAMLMGIEKKHGSSMNELWQETFGYGIDKLTQGEAGYLKSAKTVDSIRERIAKARHARINDVHEKRVEETLRPKSSIVINQYFIDYGNGSSVGELSVLVNGKTHPK